MRYKDANKILPNVKCPYFVSVTEKAISCEGVSKSNKVVVCFETKGKKMDHINSYCYNFPNSCPIAKAVDRKYEVNK